MHQLRQRDRCGIDKIPPALSFLRQRDVGAALWWRQRQRSLSGPVGLPSTRLTLRCIDERIRMTLNVVMRQGVQVTTTRKLDAECISDALGQYGGKVARDGRHLVVPLAGAGGWG